jgi:spore coat polysaccharide biosynthesis protein SpsF (cytidylyltransferase family)
MDCLLNIPIIIQARMGSSRLPCKPFLLLNKGKSIIEVLCRRALLISKKLNLAENIYLITPKDEVEIFKNFLSGINNIVIFGGSENNVAERYASAMEKYSIDACIRVTSDNPFVVIEVFKEILSFRDILNHNAISFYHQKQLPNGTVISLITRNYAIDAAKTTCRLANEHLIVTEDKLLQTKIVKPEIDKKLCKPTLRFCIDHIDDYKYILNKRINFMGLSYKYIYKIFDDRQVLDSY